MVLVLLRRVCSVYLILLHVNTLNYCGSCNFSGSVLGKHVHLILLDQSWFLAYLMYPNLCVKRLVLRVTHYWALQIYLGKLSVRFIGISLGVKCCVSVASLNWSRFNFKVSNRLMRLCHRLLNCLV